MSNTNIEDWVVIREGYLDSSEADVLFDHCRENLNWEERQISLFGREVNQPRLISYQGVKDYTYSRDTLKARPFDKHALKLIEKINGDFSSGFNSILFNLYRSGQDSMGWHSDDEPELGVSPQIASLSVGAKRKFVFRHRKSKEKAGEFFLNNGDLLIMKPGCQERFQHGLPKTKKDVGERINLTFRNICE